MSMDTLLTQLTAVLMGLNALLGQMQEAQKMPVTPVVQDAIEQQVSIEVQQAMQKYTAGAQAGPIFGASLPIAGSTYTLAGSGVSNSATSITLSSLMVTQNGHAILDAELSPTFYITLEPGNKTKQEIVSCTTVTQNANGTATLSGCTRGLSPITPFTSDSTLKFSHGGGSSVIFSNPPQFYNEFANLSDDETVTGQWTFSSFPITPSNSACTTTVAGVCELATQAETAAGTVTGGTGGNLVIANSTATSTYATSTAPNRVVVTRANGTIDPKFFGTTTVQFYVGPPSAPSLYAFPTTTVNGIAVSSTTVTTFNASGTWVKPTSGTMAFIEAWGAGGGGAGVNTADHGASGGGGGGYSYRFMRMDDLTTNVTVTIGTGGSGGTNSNVGTAGGDTTFGAFLTAYGGGGGMVCINDTNDFSSSGGGGGGLMSAGGAGQSNAASSAGSPSGITGAGASGGAGGVGYLGGGAGGGCTGGGGSSVGGASFYGGGGGGGGSGSGSSAGGASTLGGAGGAGQNGTNGTAGTQPGGGGGGADANSTTGGAGGAGRVRVTVF